MRFQDTKRELRIRLNCTTKSLFGNPIRFYHEDTDRKNQVLAATLSADQETLDITIFTDRLDTIKPKNEKENI